MKLINMVRNSLLRLLRAYSRLSSSVAGRTIGSVGLCLGLAMLCVTDRQPFNEIMEPNAYCLGTRPQAPLSTVYVIFMPFDHITQGVPQRILFIGVVIDMLVVNAPDVSRLAQGLSVMILPRSHLGKSHLNCHLLLPGRQNVS